MYWEISHRTPSPKQEEILGWIRDKVSIAPYFRHFKGDFKGSSCDSDKPPAKMFKNNTSCKFFTQFVQKTLINRVKCGAISIVAKVGVVYPPHIVLPLTVDSRAHKALWMCDMPFSLDSVSDLPRYVRRDTYQTVLDDKSGCTSSPLKGAAPSLVSSGEDGTSRTIRSRSDRRSHPTYTIPQDT